MAPRGPAGWGRGRGLGWGGRGWGGWRGWHRGGAPNWYFANYWDGPYGTPYAPAVVYNTSGVGSSYQQEIDSVQNAAIARLAGAAAPQSDNGFIPPTKQDMNTIKSITGEALAGIIVGSILGLVVLIGLPVLIVYLIAKAAKSA